jgi:hypothetical protein
MTLSGDRTGFLHATWMQHIFYRASCTQALFGSPMRPMTFSRKQITAHNINPKRYFARASRGHYPTKPWVLSVHPVMQFFAKVCERKRAQKCAI